MRRGIRGGGGGRNARNNAMPAMRDIQDLDRELELLRQKRQLIEKQQRQYQPQYQPQQNFNSRGHTISPWDQEPQIRSNEYNQPRLSYNQLEFSNLYNSGQSYSAHGPSGFDSGPRNRKRPFNGSRRQDDPTGPKRFRNNRPASTGANFNPPKKFAPKAKPAQGAGGGSQFSNQSQNKSGPNKKKPFTSPNAKPADSRPSKPTQAPNSAPHKKQAKGPFLDYVLKDDVYKNFPKKVQSRIQFATGIIFKNLVVRQGRSDPRRTLYPQLKPLINARIYKALMNKEIGNCQNIIDSYDAAYPASTDDELMKLVANNDEDEAKLESQNLDSQSNTVKDYFKINISPVMDKKLAEMITKLKQAYEIEYNLQETAEDGDNVDVNIDENNVETAAESTNNDETKPADAENTDTDDKPGVDERANVTEGDGNAAAEEPAAAEELENVEGDNAEEPNEGTKETKPVEAVIKKKVENKIRNLRATKNYHVTRVDELVNRELWRLLARIKDVKGNSFFKDLLAIMNMDPDFVKAKNDIAKAADENRVEILNQPLHYVVLAGKPHLPNKIKFKGFLRRFHPTSIKKHRKLRNVLIIGFADLQDQSNILNANGTFFEKVKLSITESKNMTDATEAKEAKTENGEDNDVTEEDNQEINESLQSDGAEESFQTNGEPVEEAKNVINTDHDGEISDQLTSLQESEYNPNDTTEDSEMIDDSGVTNDGIDAQQGDESEYQQDNNEEAGDIMQESNDEQGGNGNVKVITIEATSGEENPSEESKDDKPQSNDDTKATAVATKLAAASKPAASAKPAVASKPAAATKPAVAARKPAAPAATKPAAAATKAAVATPTKAAVATPTKAAVATPTKTATKGAANTVQTRRSGRLP